MWGILLGFFLIMAKTDVVELNMSVDEALKYIISMGVVDLETLEKKSLEQSKP